MLQVWGLFKNFHYSHSILDIYSGGPLPMYKLGGSLRFALPVCLDAITFTFKHYDITLISLNSIDDLSLNIFGFPIPFSLESQDVHISKRIAQLI